MGASSLSLYDRRLSGQKSDMHSRTLRKLARSTSFSALCLGVGIDSDNLISKALE